jgi:hypothetical protein
MDISRITIDQPTIKLYDSRDADCRDPSIFPKMSDFRRRTSKNCFQIYLRKIWRPLSSEWADAGLRKE